MKNWRGKVCDTTVFIMLTILAVTNSLYTLFGKLMTQSQCQKPEVEAEVLMYERRITKQQFMQAFGFVAMSIALRAVFRELKGDKSAPINLTVKAIDDPFQYAMQCEGTGILVDL